MHFGSKPTTGFFANSGDTEWVDDLLLAVGNSDLLLVEAYFFDKPIKFHLDFATLAAKRSQIDTRRVILTHLSTEMLRRVRETGYEIAEDGETVINLRLPNTYSWNHPLRC